MIVLFLQRRKYTLFTPLMSEKRAGGLGKGGEGDSVLVEREGGVDVLHERVAKQPHAAPEADVLARECADTLARTR